MTQPRELELIAMLHLPVLAGIPQADVRTTYSSGRRRQLEAGEQVTLESDGAGPGLLLAGRLEPRTPDAVALAPGDWLLPSLVAVHQAAGPAVLLFPGLESIRRWARLSHDLAVALVDAQIGVAAAGLEQPHEALAEPRLIEQIGRQMLRCRRDGRPLVVARIVAEGSSADAASGGQALGRVEAAIARTVRPNDGFGRFGSDGFLLSLVGLDRAEAAAVVLRLHAAAAGSGAERPLSISTGLAGIHAEDSVDAAINRAESALSRARAMGLGSFSF
jgi:GGDEF domain-containing protein